MDNKTMKAKIDLDVVDYKAKQITKVLTPQYPLGCEDVYPIVFDYLIECHSTNTKHSWDKIERKLEKYVIEGR